MIRVAHLDFREEAAREGIRAYLAALERRGQMKPEKLAERRKQLDEMDSAGVDERGLSVISD